jgi:hypothetical protein
MDAKKRRALIKALDDAKKFDSNYSEPNRLWFLEKVLSKLEAEGLGDSAIEQQAGEVTQKAKAIVKANRDFSLALTAGGNARFTKRALEDMRRHRVEILYGAIAFDRKFVEPQHLKYLLFIAKRRFRSICRMYFWVNPNGQGYFRYPHTCPTDQHWRVNEDAEPFWERLSPPRDIPIKLEQQAGGSVDPMTALAKLFVKKTDPCTGNLLDCSTTASIIFMESLLEAKDADRFLKKLASKGSDYLIIHQLGFAGATNFAEDATDEGVMRTVGRPAADLQVGDHAYIYNHPLYKSFRPTGSWRGEHSFVYISGDRNYKSQDGFVFGGHGKNGTLYQFYDAFLTELKSHLAIARQLMVVHLAFLRGGAAAIAPGTVKEEEHDISVGGKPATAYRLLEYDANVQAKDYTKIPTKKKKPKQAAPAFVITQSKTEHVFYLDQVEKPDEDKPLDKNLKRTIASIVTVGKLSHPLKLQRIAQPPAGAPPNVVYDKGSWGVAYLDLSTNTERIWPFFELQGEKLQRKELTHDDLFQSPFALFTKAGTDLRVRQPKVDFGAGHQGFLTANGAF